MDENEKLMARMDRISDHYAEYADEIESAKESDGMYYIFKMLWRALNFNVKAVGTTRTTPTEQVAKECQKQAYLIDNSTAAIANAYCELMDQDYENRMDSNDEYLEYWMHEADYWRDQCNADD